MMKPWAIQVELPLLHLPRGLSQLSSRLLTWQDHEDVLAFRRQIFSTLPREFRLTDPDCENLESAEIRWAQTHLSHPAVTLGIFHGSTLIAFASLILPQTASEDDRLSHLLGLSDSEIKRSAQMAACMVAEDFRGLRLQPKLLAWRRHLAVLANRSFIASMTACGNVYSMRNLLEAGMSIRWVGELKPDRWWQILAMELQPPSAAPPWLNPVWVKGDDYRQQAALTQLNYEGVVEIAEPGINGQTCNRIEFAQRAVLATK
jgi:hypothetical protein